MMLIRFHMLGEVSKKKSVNITLIKKLGIHKLPSCSPCLMTRTHDPCSHKLEQLAANDYTESDPRHIRNLFFKRLLPLHLMHLVMHLVCDKNL